MGIIKFNGLNKDIIKIVDITKKDNDYFVYMDNINGVANIKVNIGDYIVGEYIEDNNFFDPLDIISEKYLKEHYIKLNN